MESKTTAWIFQVTAWEDWTQDDLNMNKKRNPPHPKNGSLLIAAENDAIRTSYIKASRVANRSQQLQY